MSAATCRQKFGLVVCLGLACSAPVWSGAAAAPPETPDAQTAAQGAVELTTVEVLGSHIRRVDVETQHPVFTVDRAEILRTGLSSVSDIIQNIVFNGETLNRHINNGGNGEMLANLRSLGFNRTLVLLNGQRFVTDIGGGVDLSAIPFSIVDHIDVLLDSASAIYGSDAIAGVINIVTRSGYEGGELGIYGAQYDQDDGQRVLYDLSYGTKGDGWSASAGIEYGRDDPVFAGSREISSVPRYGLPTAATGSNATPYSWLTPKSRRSLGRVAPLRLRPGRPGTSIDDFRPIVPFAEAYNYAPLNYMETPQQRRSVFAQGRYEIGSDLALTADVLVNQRSSAQQLAEPVVGFSSNNPGVPDGFGISADNAYNPFGEPIITARRRFSESGPRVFDQTADTGRLHVGLDGAFVLAARDFTWGADAIATQVRAREFTGTYADDRKLALAVGPSYFDASGVAHCGTPDATIAGCVPINLFGPPGSLTPAMLDYVNANEINRTSNDSRVVDAHATTNQLFELPAGGLGFAAGIQYRRESGSQIIDPLRASGNENGNGASHGSTTGSYSVKEAYLEFDAPLLADKPFAQKLDFIVGTRYSRYTNFGATTNSQYGMRWKPVDDLLLRANYAEGFRAPAVSELFGGTEQVSGVPEDPCDQINADIPPTPATLARCTKLGVPPNVDSSTAGGATLSGGNPDLQPETSRSSGLGIVYTPQQLTGLDLSIDWYQIQVRNAIADPGAQAVVDDCYMRNADAACAYIVRDPVNGTLHQVTDLKQNLRGGIETEGYDFTVNWRHEMPVGRLSAHWVTNYVDYFGEIGQPQPGSTLADGSIAFGNTAGLSSPTVSNLFGVIWRWRSQLQVAWENDSWSASITGRYYSSILEDCGNVTFTALVVHDPSLRNLCSNPDHEILIGGFPVAENRVPSVTYTDIEGTWHSPWNAYFTFGVRNALDRTPPVSYSAFANSFFPEYDMPGRFFYVRYRQKF
jgi:iron complex outermembrane receptor protein